MKKARPAMLEIARLYCSRMTLSIKRKDGRLFDQRRGKRTNWIDQRPKALFRQPIWVA
jgi:hypothetical protein